MPVNIKHDTRCPKVIELGNMGGVGALKSHAGGVKYMYELKLKARERHTLFHYCCTLYVQALHVLQIDTIRYHSWVLATLYLDIF